MVAKHEKIHSTKIVIDVSSTNSTLEKWMNMLPLLILNQIAPYLFSALPEKGYRGKFSVQQY